MRDVVGGSGRGVGYLLALDDFDPAGPTGALLDLADIVKVDFMAFTEPDARQRIAHDLVRRGITLLAEKVETAEDIEQARQFGYTYAQGYFFARPEISRGTRSSGFKPHRLQLLRELNGADPDLDVIEELLRHDPALSYQIIRYLNSTAFGLRSRVQTIRQAVHMLGQAGLRTWATVVILALRLLQPEHFRLITVSVSVIGFSPLVTRNGRRSGRITRG